MKVVNRGFLVCRSNWVEREKQKLITNKFLNRTILVHINLYIEHAAAKKYQ